MDRETVLDALAGLIRIPSINPSIAPGEGVGEARVAAWARDWLTAHGVEAWLEEAAPGRPNAVARVGDGDGPTLVLCAHLDTVGVAEMTIDPFEPRLAEGRVYGRGSYDMKGGAAACMAAASSLAGGRLPGTVLLALVADEEYASLGARHFVGLHPADACILTEPSEGRLILAHKGFVWVRLRTEGTAAHGSRWDLGVSAIGRMGRIVAALERHDREVLRGRVHALVGPASLHCALIEGGVGLSTYSPHCALQVERRTLPGEQGRGVLAEIGEVVRQAGEDAEIELLLEREPMTTPRDAPIAMAVREAAREVTGAEPEEGGVAYWMDAAIFSGAGIPTVNIGAAGEGAHADVEWTDLDSVVACARTLVGAARRFCGSAPA